MFDTLKVRFTTHLIGREIQKQKRVKKAINLDSAKKIGILFNLADEQVASYVDDFISNLANLGKSVHAICYLHDKKIPDYYIPKLKIDILQPKDLNIFGIPNTPQARNFIKNDFDILLDLSLNDANPLDYLAALSIASFKVGRYRKSMVRVFDLMIRNREDMDFKDYYKSLLQYLSRINK